MFHFFVRLRQAGWLVPFAPPFSLPFCRPLSLSGSLVDGQPTLSLISSSSNLILYVSWLADPTPSLRRPRRDLWMYRVLFSGFHLIYRVIHFRFPGLQTRNLVTRALLTARWLHVVRGVAIHQRNSQTIHTFQFPSSSCCHCVRKRHNGQLSHHCSTQGAF